MDILADKKILIVDDEVTLQRMVNGILRQAGFYNVMAAATCKEAREVFSLWQPEGVLLDVMLPDGDGFSLFGEMRELMPDIPVLFLSAKDEDESRLTGLGLGADDYITKPFLPKELVLRLSTVLRRTYGSRASQSVNQVIHLGDTTVDWGSCSVVKAGAERQNLTAKEYALFKKLYENRGNIVTIDALCMAAWDGNENDGLGFDSTLMVHIRRLREKIEVQPSKPQWLVTVRGLGYKLEKEQ